MKLLDEWEYFMKGFDEQIEFKILEHEGDYVKIINYYKGCSTKIIKIL
jgi:hypothetical protein